MRLCVAFICTQHWQDILYMYILHNGTDKTMIGNLKPWKNTSDIIKITKGICHYIFIQINRKWDKATLIEEWHPSSIGLGRRCACGSGHEFMSVRKSNWRVEERNVTWLWAEAAWSSGSSRKNHEEEEWLSPLVLVSSADWPLSFFACSDHQAIYFLSILVAELGWGETLLPEQTCWPDYFDIERWP